MARLKSDSKALRVQLRCPAREKRVQNRNFYSHLPGAVPDYPCVSQKQ